MTPRQPDQHDQHDPGPPDVQLLAAARSGDRAAFTRIYDRHVRPVYWQAYRVLRDDHLSEEATQETFFAAWRRRGSIRVADESVLPWLLVTARWTAMNLRRRQQRPDHRTVELDPGLDGAPDARRDAGHQAARSVEDEVADAAVRTEIEAAVGALSATDRRLYALCVDGDHTYAQAAAVLGVSHSSVRNRVHRLRQRLRADLRALRETT